MRFVFEVMVLGVCVNAQPKLMHVRKVAVLQTNSTHNSTVGGFEAHVRKTAVTATVLLQTVTGSGTADDPYVLDYAQLVEDNHIAIVGGRMMKFLVFGDGFDVAGKKPAMAKTSTMWAQQARNLNTKQWKASASVHALIESDHSYLLAEAAKHFDRYPVPLSHKWDPSSKHFECSVLTKHDHVIHPAVLSIHYDMDMFDAIENGQVDLVSAVTQLLEIIAILDAIEWYHPLDVMWDNTRQSLVLVNWEKASAKVTDEVRACEQISASPNLNCFAAMIQRVHTPQFNSV